MIQPPLTAEDEGDGIRMPMLPDDIVTIKWRELIRLRELPSLITSRIIKVEEGCGKEHNNFNDFWKWKCGCHGFICKSCSAVLSELKTLAGIEGKK